MDTGLVFLQGLVKMKILDLGQNEISDAGLPSLRAMKELTNLNLVGADVTDAGLANLECLPQLRDLDLIGTAVTKQGVEKLGLALPNCRIWSWPPQESKPIAPIRRNESPC